MYQATNHPWLVSVPIVDARSRFYGILDLVRNAPVAPEEYSVLEEQLSRLTDELCATLESRRQRRRRRFELELHARAAELLRTYKTAEVYHAIVDHLKRYFSCEQADLLLVSGDRMVLAASTRVPQSISQQQRATFAVRRNEGDGRRCGDAREEADALFDLFEKGSGAKSRVIHGDTQRARATRGLSAELCALLEPALEQERLVVPVFEATEQREPLLTGVLQLVGPRRDVPGRRPTESGESREPYTTRFVVWDVREAHRVAQSLEPILRLMRVIDEHGLQVNELVHSLGQPLQALRSTENSLVRAATRRPPAAAAELAAFKGKLDEQYQSVERSKERLGFLAQLYGATSRLGREPRDLALELRKAMRAAPRDEVVGGWFHEELAELPPLPVERAWMEQALVNLLHNVAKYAYQNTRIDVKLAESTDGVFRITVGNLGTGIPQEDLERIFLPYYRANVPERMGQRKGSGLGLALVREAIERVHGGRVGAESRPANDSEVRARVRSNSDMESIESVPHLTTFVIELSRSKLEELARVQETVNGSTS